MHWVDTTYALALLQILITTGLIAYRIRSQEVSSKVVRVTPARGLLGRGSGLMPIVLIAVDSAVFYALITFAAVILYASKSDAQFLLREAVIPTAGEYLEPPVNVGLS